MNYRRRRGPLDVLARVSYQLTRAIGQIFRAACVPFLLIADFWSGLIYSGSRTLRRLGRVNLLRLLLTYLRLPFFESLRAMRWIFAGLIGWWPRASLIHLLQGLPAIGGVLLMTLPLAFSRGREVPIYAQAAEDNLNAGNFEKAEVYFRALTEKEPESQLYRYGLAMAADGLREHERALAIMSSLAPTEKQGFGLAHRWMALQSQLLKDGEQEAHLKRYLQSAAPGSPAWSEAHEWLGTLCFYNNRLQEAETHLLKSKNPELWLRIAELYLKQGNFKKAREGAERAIEFFRPKAEADVDDINSRLCWATAVGSLGDYKQAAQILEDGLKFSSDPRLPQQLGAMYFRWAELLKSGNSGGAAAQHTLLVRCFYFDPNNFMLLHRVVEGVKDQGSEEATLLRSVMRTLLSQGHALGTVDILLAIDAEARHQSSAADNYLRKAREVEPKTAYLLSQLVMYEVQGLGQPRRDNAYSLANLGLRAWPDDPDMLYARGGLHALDKHWIESLIDLEAALPKSGNRPELHRLLAEVYRNLGMQDKADAHLERATAAR